MAAHLLATPLTFSLRALISAHIWEFYEILETSWQLTATLSRNESYQLVYCSSAKGLQ